MNRRVRPFVAAAAVVYTASLVLAALLLRGVGEHWWASGVLLYLPRLGFALPLPFAAMGLWAAGYRKLLLTQGLAALLVLFPLMGLVLPLPFSAAKEPRIKLLSFNVDSFNYGPDRVADAVESHRADIVLFQEVAGPVDAVVQRLRRSYQNVQVIGQFLIATSFPITSSAEPPRIPYNGKSRSPRFIRYTVESPLGPLVIYSVHPISPRYGLYWLRGQGLRREIASGRLLTGVRSGPFAEDAALRELQVQAFAKMAGGERGSVIIAGDTNLATLSPVFAENLSSYTDGFSQAGAGFGYTFPAKHAWMRIDRILTTKDLGVGTFRVSCGDCSDHLCVVADVGRAR